MTYTKLLFVVLVCSVKLAVCEDTTTKSTEKSTTLAQTSTISSTAAQTTTTKPSATLSSSTVKSTNKTTETIEKTLKNVSEPLESNDLATSASGHRGTTTRSVPGFNEHFAQCKRNTPEFDKCIREGLNNVRNFISTGVPELKIPSFDPIFAKEVILRRGGPTFGYKLKLKNVRESGWRLSEVTKFKSNLKLNTVQITQYFPDKYLEGEYEFESLILNPNSNKGQFNLSLYELNQTTTLSKPRNSKSIKVNVDVQEIGDMKLHISNLLRGRTRMENLLDRMINSPAWRPGFVIVRPFVNELVSTAFTEIYNRVFNNFDFDAILPPA